MNEERKCFYSYDEKYIDEDGNEIKVNEELKEKVENEISEIEEKDLRVMG